MRTDELAMDYIERAELTLEDARNAFEKEVYSLAIRRAQETCELSLNGGRSACGESRICFLFP